jgi:hypothetical protein
MVDKQQRKLMKCLTVALNEAYSDEQAIFAMFAIAVASIKRRSPLEPCPIETRKYDLDVSCFS